MNFNLKIDDKLKISIITPNYNYSKFIEQCILSVVKQDYDDVEHIIVDDGSTDNSVEIIKKLQEKYPNKIKLIQQENKGQTPAINRGLIEANGDIVGWINSDDYYEKDVFSKIISEFQNDKDLMVIYGNFKIVEENGQIVRKIKNIDFNYFLFLMKGFGINMPNNTVFWRRNLLNKIGFLDESFYFNMDGEFFARLTYGQKTKRINLFIANYRKHSQTKTSEVLHKEILYKQERDYELFNNYNRLKISKFIPAKYITFIRIPSLIFRAAIKLFYQMI